MENVLFALTAHNPLGITTDSAGNQVANDKLRTDLAALKTATAGQWNAFGFASNWREDGFVVGFSPAYAADGQREIVDLAAKYQQGAIYKYEREKGREDSNSLLRSTVPVQMTEIASDVAIEPCMKPSLPQAEP
jgi:hypothetical protein